MICGQLLYGQEFNLSSVTASIGKGALSSGYDISIAFSNGENTFKVTGNHTRVYGTYSWEVFHDARVLATGGFFKNTPWFGPQVIFSPADFVTLTSWYGFSFGTPEHPDWKMTTMVQYNAISIKVAGITVTYAISKFVYDPIDYIPGVAYSGSINKSWGYNVSVDYTVNGKEPLFMFGLQCKF